MGPRAGRFERGDRRRRALALRLPFARPLGWLSVRVRSVSVRSVRVLSIRVRSIRVLSIAVFSVPARSIAVLSVRMPAVGT
jgi:hypothetical protein